MIDCLIIVHSHYDFIKRFPFVYCFGEDFIMFYILESDYDASYFEKALSTLRRGLIELKREGTTIACFNVSL